MLKYFLEIANLVFLYFAYSFFVLVVIGLIVKAISHIKPKRGATHGRT